MCMRNKLIAVVALSFVAAVSFGQPRLRPDNIDEIVKAMTDEEKVSLLVGFKEVHDVL